MDTNRYRPTFVEIRLDRLKKNFEFIAKSVFAKQFLCPMVKANSYGHGDIQTVKYLESLGCQRFGVGLIEEGLRIRRAGVLKPDVFTFGFTGREAVREILHHNLYPVVSDFQQLDDLKTLAKQTVSLHLKVNTGMNRLGFVPEDVEKALQVIRDSKNLKLTGICTHLMSAEDLSQPDGVSFQQIEKFHGIVQKHRLDDLTKHVYNSHGFLNALNSDLCRDKFLYGLRPGIALWGVHPDSHDQSQPLYPVAQLKSKIVTTQTVQKNQSVSYGGTWTAKEKTVVGIVPIGYADGVPVQLSNRGQIAVDGKRVPIVGRVCMDYILVNLNGIDNPVGKDVELFGETISPHEVATNSGTIVWDVLTRLSERVPRVFTGSEI